ncbi:pseudouridine synthase [Aquibium carbonis]|uniref:Pseudouridine synthase n=1 Tax=Aquibium carbonis TaxID=2495581 RepID=A0A3R9ZT08_9HYPH|nr:pseudouridine synthase [Aquibium carbonis]RST87015.1 pseudouridine synthase [Aquibium carbonis]
MDDDTNDKRGRGPRGGDAPRKGPGKPRADRPAGGGAKTSSFGGAPRSDARPRRFDGDRPGGAAGESKPYRGKSPAGGKPFRADGPSAGGKPYRPRGAEGDARPYRARKPEGEAGSAERPARRFDRDDARPGGDRPRKPFVKRAPAGDAPAGERPARRFDGDKPRGAPGEGKPYRSRAPGEGKPFRADGPSAGGKPFRPRGAEGDAKPYRARKPEGEAGSTERPARRFDRDETRSGGDRPRKPFVKRTQDGDAPAGARPERRFDGDRKPREDRGDRQFRTDKPFRAAKPGFRERPARDARPDGRGSDRSSAPAEESGAVPERIAKRLARAGVASRRDAESLVADGRVAVNGQVLTSPAFNVVAADRITIDGKPIPEIERTRLFLFHKPGGLVTTNRDPEGRPTIFEALPDELPRLITVGRLDINTEGLLLLTNDGGLARLLELPATGWLRRYRVRVHGHVDEKQLASLRDGVAVDGVFYGAIEATLDREQGSNAWLTIGLREGKNREVKNILASLGLDVNRLIRISYGPFQLGDLAEGAVQEIKGRMLRDQLGERLIEEAGANFDAPVTTPFTNKPTVAPRREADPEHAERGSSRSEPGEGGLIKNRKRDREAHRENVLGRLQTARPSFGGKKRENREEREEKAYQPPRARSSNVWMAPGARPQGKKNEAEAEADAAPKRSAGPRKGQAGPRKAPVGTRNAPTRNGPGKGPTGGAGRGPRKPRRDD